MGNAWCHSTTSIVVLMWISKVHVVMTLYKLQKYNPLKGCCFKRRSGRICDHQTPINLLKNSSDALPSSLINSNMNLRWKQQENKKLGHVPWLAALWG
jgi:hypothetical protein